MVFEQVEIGRSGSEIGEGQIEVALFLVVWIVVGAVHGKCENARFVRAQRGRAVALVDVEIDDQDARSQTLVKQAVGRENEVV